MDSNNPPCDERAQRSPSKAPAVRAAQEGLALISASANTVGCSVRAAHEATNGGFQGVWGFHPQPRMHTRSGDVSMFHHLSPSPPPPHAAQSTPGQRWGGPSSAMGGDVVGDGKGGLKHFAWLELSIAPSRAEEAPSSVLADVSPCQRSEI